MNSPHLETVHLSLQLKTPSEALADIEALPPEHRSEVLPGWVERLRDGGDPDPWTHGFRLVHRPSGETVGSAGFKGPPDAEGAVELAYHVAPEHERRGYATEAAAVLSVWALSQPGVRVVRAHTLPVESGSTRVLGKCGFQRLGEVTDPHDGPVWRWEKERG